MSDSPKPWFVGRGVKLWRRPDFHLQPVPFRAFAADYQDGLIEVVGLDHPRSEMVATRNASLPGTRLWLPWQMCSAIEVVDLGQLATWQKECGIDLSHVGGPTLEDANRWAAMFVNGSKIIIDPNAPPGTFRIRQARSGSG